jgi:hypothetical protein
MEKTGDVPIALVPLRRVALARRLGELNIRERPR